MNPSPTEDGWQRTLKRLSEAFGMPFSVTVLSDVSGGTLRPVIQNMSVAKHRLVIPIGRKAGNQAVAVGTLDAHPRELLERLLEVAVRYVLRTLELDEHRLDLEACTQQIGQDFEVFHWIHRQLQHLRDDDASLSFADFAEGVLVSLCRTVGAEAMAALTADTKAPPAGQALPLVGRTLIRIGPNKHVVSDDGCCQLVNRLREVADVHPLVQNEMKRRREFSMVPGVRSCILVPVTRRHVFFGWLLALNRVPATGGSEPATGGIQAPATDDEFGSAEASLIESAAAMLALHPCCEELFSGWALSPPGIEAHGRARERDQAT